MSVILPSAIRPETVQSVFSFQDIPLLVDTATPPAPNSWLIGTQTEHHFKSTVMPVEYTYTPSSETVVVPTLSTSAPKDAEDGQKIQIDSANAVDSSSTQQGNNNNAISIENNNVNIVVNNGQTVIASSGATVVVSNNAEGSAVTSIVETAYSTIISTPSNTVDDAQATVTATASALETPPTESNQEDVQDGGILVDTGVPSFSFFLSSEQQTSSTSSASSNQTTLKTTSSIQSSSSSSSSSATATSSSTEIPTSPDTTNSASSNLLSYGVLGTSLALSFISYGIMNL